MRDLICSLKYVPKKKRKKIVTMRLLNKLSKRKHGISKKMHLLVISVWDNI